MFHGVVDAELAALVEGLVLEILYGIRKTHAERDMACGVLVEEGLVEQEAVLGDRGVYGDQRALTEVCGALVH